LRRFITPIGFGDKVLKLKRFLGFSLKPFLKRLAGKQFFERFEPKSITCYRSKTLAVFQKQN